MGALNVFEFFDVGLALITPLGTNEVDKLISTTVKLIRLIKVGHHQVTISKFLGRLN